METNVDTGSVSTRESVFEAANKAIRAALIEQLSDPGLRSLLRQHLAESRNALKTFKLLTNSTPQLTPSSRALKRKVR